jgi:hypothetical protein
MKAGVIYAREMARNSPVSVGASGRQMEQLWQHHFLLDMSPLEHLLNGLGDKTRWRPSPEEGAEKWYLAAAPEYTIECIDDLEGNERRCTEFYAARQHNKQASFFSIIGRYHQTVLIDQQGACLDSGRYRTAVAERGFIHKDGMPDPDKPYTYMFYVKGTVPWMLHCFLYDERHEEARSAHGCYMDLILVFDSYSQKQDFEAYVDDHWDELESLRSRNEPTGLGRYDELEREAIVRDLKTVDALKKLYMDWYAEMECPETSDI